MSKQTTIISLIAFIFSGAVFSQESYVFENDTIFPVYTLEEIIVYGNKVDSNPSKIIEIDADQIKARNSVNAADVLKFESGLTVTSGPKAETETRIRGFPARSVLVLVDGRPINPGYYGKVDISMLPVDNIAKIKVIKGPASVAYGANGMGGVINVITKNGMTKPQTDIDMEFGDFQFRRLSINHSQKLNKINYWISGYENHAKGFQLSDDFNSTSLEDGGIRDNSFYHKIGGNFKINYQPSEKSLYSLSFGYHWAKKNVATTIYSWDSPEFRIFPEWKRYSAALSGQWNLTPGFELKSSVFWDFYSDRLIDYGSDKQMRQENIDWDSLLNNNTIGGSVDGKISTYSTHQLRIGLKYKIDLMDKKPDIDESWYSHHVFTGNFFVEDVFQPFEPTNITVGAGYNVHQTEHNGLIKSQLCPMFSVNQLLFYGIQFTASYANSIRFPTIHQLYSETSGNVDLKPEQADKFEITLDRTFLFNKAERYTSVGFSLFQNNLKNLIYRTSRSNRFNNIEEAQFRGVEIHTNWSYNRYLSGDFSYGYLKLLKSSGDLMDEIPENKFRVYLELKIGSYADVNYEYTYFDERKTYIPGRLLNNYSIHNINISRSLGKKFKVYIKGNNLADIYYEEELGYPGPGRQVTAGIRAAL